MSVIGRAFLILFGLCCAFVAGAFTLLVAAVSEPGFGGMLAYGASAFMDFVFNTAFLDDRPEQVAFVLMGLWTVMATVLAGPPTLAALIGEIARLRSFVWYSGATGLFTALLPWVARTGFGNGSVSGTWSEGRVTMALFFCGAVSGLVYWLIAGRSAGGERPDSQVATTRVGSAPPQT